MISGCGDQQLKALLIDLEAAADEAIAVVEQLLDVIECAIEDLGDDCGGISLGQLREAIDNEIAIGNGEGT